MDILEFGKSLFKKDENTSEKFLDAFSKELQKQIHKDDKLLSDFRKEGEIYEVDEIGDDDKYVFLTRKSDGENMQEFEISDKLYHDLLNDKSETIKLQYINGEYVIIK